ncbi:MAG: MBL fold metallo-hydrolase [Clostridiales bacterium]|nr:MBL fold metallo-hydrolase [Clostridiales bacterium]
MSNLFCIGIPLPKNPLRILNSYVIKGEDRNLVIDTGFKLPECEAALRQGLLELDIDLNKTDFFITHLHSDHSGLVPALVTENSRVYLSRIEIPWMFGDTRDALWAGDRVKFQRAGFSEEELSHLWKAPDRKLSPIREFEDYLPVDDGDIFEYGGYRLKAVETPGHTPAHMCLWMEDQKTMFTGDHLLFDITPNITHWDEIDDSLGSYLDSLRMTDKFDVQLALPGHRETGDFHARTAELLSHHELRLDESLEIVRKNPGLNIYDIAGKMSWKIRCNSWEDFPITQKWFAVGECHSHLRHLEKRGLIKADYGEMVLHYYAT